MLQAGGGGCAARSCLPEWACRTAHHLTPYVVTSHHMACAMVLPQLKAVLEGADAGPLGPVHTLICNAGAAKPGASSGAGREGGTCTRHAPRAALRTLSHHTTPHHTVSRHITVHVCAALRARFGCPSLLCSAPTTRAHARAAAAPSVRPLRTLLCLCPQATSMRRVWRSLSP